MNFKEALKKKFASGAHPMVTVKSDFRAPQKGYVIAIFDEGVGVNFKTYETDRGELVRWHQVQEFEP